MEGAVAKQERPRVHIGAYVDEAQARFLEENARRHDRSRSAELRRALTAYERLVLRERDER
jgi:hypothetical protein